MPFRRSAQPAIRRWTTILALSVLPVMSGCEPRESSDSLTDAQEASESAITLNHFGFRQVHMGMPVELELYAPDRSSAEAAARAAFARIAELDTALSDWNPDSELNQLCAQPHGTVVPVSDDLFEVLRQAQTLADASDGAFDPTAGPLIRLWRQARRDSALPDEQQLDAARSRSGWQLVTLDAAAQTVTLARDDMQLDLGGIAKGFIGDEAIRTLKDHGIERCLFAAGGDVVAAGPPPDAEGWRIDPTHYANPGDVESGAVPILWLAHSAASISGDTVQFVEIDGVRYSHVVDPRQGQAITTRRMCVVRAARGVDADALATLGTIIPVAEHAAIADQYDAEAWVFTAHSE